MELWLKLFVAPRVIEARATARGTSTAQAVGAAILSAELSV